MVLVAVFEYPYFVQVLTCDLKSNLFLYFPDGRMDYILAGAYMSGYGNIPKSRMGVFVFGTLLNKYFSVFGVKPNMDTWVKNPLFM